LAVAATYVHDAAAATTNIYNIAHHHSSRWKTRQYYTDHLMHWPVSSVNKQLAKYHFVFVIKCKCYCKFLWNEIMNILFIFIPMFTIFDNQDNFSMIKTYLNYHVNEFYTTAQ